MIQKEREEDMSNEEGKKKCILEGDMNWCEEDKKHASKRFENARRAEFSKQLSLLPRCSMLTLRSGTRQLDTPTGTLFAHCVQT